MTISTVLIVNESIKNRMHTNKNGIRLRECPLCGQEVEIESGTIVCRRCRLSFDLVGCYNLQNYIDKYWNKRFYDVITPVKEKALNKKER